MAIALGKFESRLIAYTQMRRLKTVRTGELVRALGITAQQERELFSRLARRSLIARVRRGLYLVPSHLPPGGKWSPSEFVALTTLIEDRGGQYQICGPSAFSRYGWDGQVSNRLYAYNNRLSGERKIGSASMTLIKLADKRLGETETFRTADGIEAVYSSRVRSLVDAVYDWSRFDSLPRGYNWIRAELNRDSNLAERIVRIALRYGNMSTLRRIGTLLELEGVAERLLQKLSRSLTPSSALIPWVPNLPKRGTVDRRWGVIVNHEL
ncbi:MAG: type IV toxin-antitoxin system AbiEi family antitoxin domain-containing protein [Thermoguttaceae bacterium]